MIFIQCVSVCVSVHTFHSGWRSENNLWDSALVVSFCQVGSRDTIQAINTFLCSAILLAQLFFLWSIPLTEHLQNRTTGLGHIWSCVVFMTTLYLLTPSHKQAQARGTLSSGIHYCIRFPPCLGPPYLYVSLQ